MTVEAVDGGFDIGLAADIGVGTMRGVALPGRRIVVANIGGTYSAFDELCPHLSVPMSQGKLEGDCVTCVGHGSVFQLPSGEVRKWLGRRPGFISSLLSGKPTPIRTWPVDVVADRLIVRIAD
jgi:nitrite reductase/ring-hydroxylating ferredoxin subunit